MKEFTIRSNESGQRFDKYLNKCLKEASSGFIYKMLRKKNITLNGRRSEGREILSEGDVVRMYFSDETFELMKGTRINSVLSAPTKLKRSFEENIIYEDEKILLLNKPSGMLSQQASENNVSAVELLIDHCLSTDFITQEELLTFKPAFCNRLDRNTTGILAAGKDLEALQTLNYMFRERRVEKYYLALVNGKFPEDMEVCAYLRKNEKTNKVQIFDHETKGAAMIKTGYEIIQGFEKCTLLRIRLYTGKSHQIRAHLAHMGHFVIGDDKYGDRSTNAYFKEKYGLMGQFLHACELKFPQEINGGLSYLSNRSFCAPMCEIFEKIINDRRAE